MTKAEFEQRMMARATNLRAMFQSMALARWIERFDRASLAEGKRLTMRFVRDLINAEE